MPKLFNDNGFLSDEGKQLINPFKNALKELLYGDIVKNLSEKELTILAGNLLKTVNDNVFEAKQLKK